MQVWCVSQTCALSPGTAARVAWPMPRSAGAGVQQVSQGLEPQQVAREWVVAQEWVVALESAGKRGAVALPVPRWTTTVQSTTRIAPETAALPLSRTVPSSGHIVASRRTRMVTHGTVMPARTEHHSDCRAETDAAGRRLPPSVRRISAWSTSEDSTQPCTTTRGSVAPTETQRTTSRSSPRWASLATRTGRLGRLPNPMTSSSSQVAATATSRSLARFPRTA